MGGGRLGAVKKCLTYQCEGGSRASNRWADLPSGPMWALYSGKRMVTGEQHGGCGCLEPYCYELKCGHVRHTITRCD